MTWFPGISTWYTESVEGDDDELSTAGSDSLEFDNYQQLLEDVKDLQLPLECDNCAIMQARFAMIAISIDEQLNM